MHGRCRRTESPGKKAYMVELHRLYPKQVEAERRLYEELFVGRGEAEVIVLSINDDDPDADPHDFTNIHCDGI